MKKLSRLLTLILALVVAFSCIACGDDNNDGDGDTGEIQTRSLNQIEYTGLHQFNSTDRSNQWLVKEGKTEYTLVYPSTADALGLRNIAKREFVKFFKSATDISIPTKTDAGLTYSDDAKYISLGYTTLLEGSGLIANDADGNPMYEDYPGELNTQGVRIVTKGNTIFIYGPSEFSTLYGVYDFMEYEFNYDFYFTDCYFTDTGVTEVPLRDYDIKSAPDIAYRCPNYGFQSFGVLGSTEDEAYDHWRCRRNYSWNKYMLRVHSEWDNVQSSFGIDHSSMDYLPPAQYSDEHGDWYAGAQLCYTAHGVAEEYEAMIRTTVAKIQNCLKLYPVSTDPLLNNVHFGIQDGGGHCGCATCQQVASMFTSSQLGGAPTGSINATCIIFINEVAKRVQHWMNYTPEDGEPLEWWDDYQGYYCTDNERRPLTFTVFAYGDYNNCPAEYNATTGKYEPMSFSNVPANLQYLTSDLNAEYDPTDSNYTGTLTGEMRDDVGIFYCGVSRGSVSFYDEPEVAGQEPAALRKLKMWGDMTDTLWIWAYSANFANHMVLSDNYAAYSEEIFQAMQGAGVKGLFNNAQSQAVTPSVFSILKSYLEDKLAWNATKNINELTIKFFKAMYQEGWQEMLQFWEDYRIHAQEGPLLDTNFNIGKEQSYPQPLVDEWRRLCDEAIEKNAKLAEVDEALYNRTVNHIDVEWVTPAYMILQWFQENYSLEEINVMKKRIKRAILDNGISNTGEHSGANLYSFVADF